MKFLDREAELARLDEMLQGSEGRLAVLYGRRRVGKTRLLLEWTAQRGGLYTVADQSAPEVQRRYLAEALATVLPGFADVDYPDWSSLLSRLAREAGSSGWRGPLVLDELPYLAISSPEIASVLQRFIDHEARAAGLNVALAGSSQRMMQGLVLSGSSPLYGRAHALFEVKPLPVEQLRNAFRTRSPLEITALYAAWGGVPRYWELGVAAGGDALAQVEELALDPLGPLHAEPDRLLLEELPPAVELRPLLDAIGLGAHRVSEIAGRIGRPVTSLARPLQRLQEMGLVRREIPFGESEKESKRSLYRIEDPFVRLWFKVVAPQRAFLASSRRAQRRALLRKHWNGLVAEAWEDLCRGRVAELAESTRLGRLGPWGVARRWWHGNQPEWDLVTRAVDGSALLVGEAKWSATPLDPRTIERRAAELAARPLPPGIAGPDAAPVLRALFVPEVSKGTRRRVGGVEIVTGRELLR